MRRVVVFDASDVASESAFWAGDLTAPEGHQVYADPAGHPFCIGWGHPDDAVIRAFVHRTFDA